MPPVVCRPTVGLPIWRALGVHASDGLFPQERKKKAQYTALDGSHNLACRPPSEISRHKPNQNCCVGRMQNHRPASHLLLLPAGLSASRVCRGEERERRGRWELEGGVTARKIEICNPVSGVSIPFVTSWAVESGSEAEESSLEQLTNEDRHAKWILRRSTKKIEISLFAYSTPNLFAFISFSFRISSDVGGITVLWQLRSQTCNRFRTIRLSI